MQTGLSGNAMKRLRREMCRLRFAQRLAVRMNKADAKKDFGIPHGSSVRASHPHERRG